MLSQSRFLGPVCFSSFSFFKSIRTLPYSWFRSRVAFPGERVHGGGTGEEENPQGGERGELTGKKCHGEGAAGNKKVRGGGEFPAGTGGECNPKSY